MDLISILLIVFGVVLDGLFIYLDDKYHGKSSIYLKTLASLMFVLLAIHNYSGGNEIYVIIALTLNMLGDFVLILRNVFKKLHDIIYIVGTLMFLAGHILLSVYLLKLDSNCLIKGLIVNIIAFGILGINLVKTIKTNGITMKAVGSVYVFVIMFTFGLAVSAVIDNANFKNIFFLIAALVFITSDSLLIIQKYKKSAPHIIQPIYRILYYVSQMMFAIYLVI